MKRNKAPFYAFIIMIISVSCSVEPKPIDYGNHNCDYCGMTIMDQRYGSEIVTETGKAYFFDAIECMANFSLKKIPANEHPELILFTDYENPGKLITAKQGVILHSPELPSPMGMYLTGFSGKEAALNYQTEKGGTLYEWESLLENFEKVRKGF